MLSEISIRRPVMTILLMFSIVAGRHLRLPAASGRVRPARRLPDDPGLGKPSRGQPETMASSIASILEKQFSTIAGVSTMTSTSTLGNTSIVLQFDLGRSIDGAALDVQSAISTAQRRLPPELTVPPSFRKVNRPTSPSCSSPCPRTRRAFPTSTGSRSRA
jgi:HAE1 family hydrophobic/amphiphilic exporter-1